MATIQNKKIILHLTPHLGGGVGSVLLNYLSFVKNNDKNYNHLVATLDYANSTAKNKAKEENLNLFSSLHDNISELLNLIKNADIILVHFWNHPLLYDFLVKNPLPESRVIFWSHTSGLTEPNIFTKKILEYPDKFVFTTPLSFETKEVKSSTNLKDFRSIWSTGGVDDFQNILPKKHSGFNIGYIGTVDYSKMHPDFIEICSQINIPDVKFIICGTGNYIDIQKQVEKMRITDKFEFLGHVNDIKKYLKIFDIFGYPLNPNHFGTCDQVLQEAMAAGILPVVLNNPMENYMLKAGEIGFVAKDKIDYIKIIENLYQNPQQRIESAQKAKKYAVSKYSVENLYKEWDEVFNEIINQPKTTKKWSLNKKNITSADVLTESLGDFGKIFKMETEDDLKKIKEFSKLPHWQSKTKGTPHQYLSFFKNDKKLEKICTLMDKI